MQQTFFRLWTLVTLCAMVLGLLPVSAAVAAPVQTSVSYATTLVSLYRVDIKLNNAYARNQLTTQQIPVLSETTTTATVLVDMNQIGWLARAGYAPQRFMSITRVAGLTTPTLSMTLPRGQRLVEVMAQTASPLRSWAQSLDAKRAGLITTSSAVDTDGDGLSDDDEAIWCLDATKKQTVVYGASINDQVLVQRAYDWMANRRAESVGYIPYPASRVNDSSGTCVDTDGDGVPNTVEIALGLNPARSSTDLDKYNDAMELFGQTVGSSTSMPAYVRNPGRHPLVAAFPKPVITIVDNSINVTLKTTVLTNGNAVSTTSRTYASRQENTVETERTDDTVWADWLRVDTSAAVGGASQRVRTMDAGGADEWTVYHKDTETSDGGTGEENWADWTGIVNCITAGFYDATSECSESFVTYEEEPAPNSGDPCVFDASGCGNDTQWDSYVTNPDEVTVGGEIAPDDMGIGDVGVCTTGLLGACVPDMFITTEDDIWDTGAADDQRPSEQSGDVIEQSTNDGSATVIDVQPIEEAPPIAPELTPQSDGATDNTEQTVSVVTYEEQDITSPGQIVTVQTIDSMTAVDTTHAADLKFTYAVRNDGTDMITELKNIKFNIYLNNDELPIVTYAPSFTFENKQPGEELRVTMGANESIPLTLEQLKAIEVDPDCAAAVVQGMLPASTQCPGGRVRITVADMSYGVDQTFYDNAVAGGMMIGVDDGTSDGASTIDWFVVPTWDGGTPDTIADVVGRYFTMLRDGDGVMTGIRTPKFSAAASLPRGCTPTLVGTGSNQIKWCEFALNKTQWMEILTDGVIVSQDIATAPASAGGKVVLRLQRDSDGDGYSDSAEQEYGTNPTNSGQRPTPELLAVVASRAVSGVTEGMLAFANLGDYPASGVKATMFSPSAGTSLRNRQVGGSGEVPAQSTLIIGSGSAVNQDASNWTGTAQVVLDGYYTGANDTQYTLTMVCVEDPCGVGEGDVSVAWVDTQGGSGTLALGDTYAAPTQRTLGEDGLTVGFETGTLLNGETIVIAATAPSDTFRWVVNDSAAPSPLVVVEYGDGSGSRRFVLPAGAYIDATSEFSIDNLTTKINTLKGKMLRAPTLDMVSRNYTAGVGGDITLMLDNPLTTTLQATQVLVRIMDANGAKVFETAQSLDDVGSGPSIVDALPWQTSDFIGGYDATKAYTVLALWGDHQGNEIDRQVRMLSDFQNDRMPELTLSIEGSTPIVIPRGTATRELNFGTLKLGDPMKRLLNITNVGDVPLRGYIDAVANAQTSFAGSFFVPPGLTLPYMLSVDSGQLDTGSYSQTVELRTSDMQWPVLRLVLKAEVTSTGAVTTQSYIIDPYRPLTTGLYVKGSRNTRDSMTYTEATGVDAVKVQPLVVRNDRTDDVLGLGRRIATNPSAYGYDPALVGLGMQGAAVAAPQGVVSPKDLLPIPQSPMRSRICGGHLHGVAVKTDGTVVAWGNNLVGQATVPAGLNNVTAVYCIGDTSYAIKNNGTVVAWGGNQNGIRDVPSNLTGVVKIAGIKNWDQGYSYAIALKNDGTLVGWGDNTYGQLNIPANLSDVVDLAGGFRHVIAVKTDGTLIGWGLDNYGGTQLNLSRLSTINNVKAVSAGDNRTMILKRDGTVVMWGSDYEGSLTVPVGLADVKQIFTMFTYSMALKNNGTVVGWGHNEYGQITLSDFNDVVDIGGSTSTSFMVRSDGTVIGRGHNGFGEIPVGINIGSLSDATATRTPTPSSSATTPDINNGCYWREANGTRHRYEYNQTQSDWFGAKSSANARTFNGVTGYLATVMTAAEQQCIYQLIGREPSASAHGTWIGGKYVAGIWTWNDGPENGQPIVTQYWRGGEPNNMGSPTDCAASHSPTYVSPWNASWNDLPCDWPTPLGSIIEYSSTGTALDSGNTGATATRTPLPSTTPSTTRTVSPTNTASGSATTPDINNGCYWREADGTRHRYQVMNSVPVNWANARANAQNASTNGVSGYLATITTPAEMECVYQLWRNANPGVDAYAWLSGSDAGHEGSWIWQSGPEKDQAVTGTYWRGGEPNNDGGNSDQREDCNGFWSGSGFVWNSSWNDSPCSGQFVGSSPIGYIVEYSSNGTALDGGNTGATATRTPTSSSNILVSVNAQNTSSYGGTGSTWYDISGNNKNFVLRNGMSLNTSFGSVMQLDGVDDYASSALVTSSTSNVSMEAYFNSSNSNQPRQLVFYNGSDKNGNGYGFAVNHENTSSGNLWLLYGGITWIDGNTTILSNTWYHVVMVISGTTLKVYVNGVLRYTGTHGAPNTPSFYTEIGRNDWPNGGYFNGQIAFARMYSNALTNAEVQSIYGGISQFPTSVPSRTPTASRTSSSNTSTSVVQLLNVGRSAFLVKQDGTVISWGTGEAANVPSGLNNVKQISGDTGNWDLGTSGEYAIALKKDGTLAQWGRVPAGMPSGLNNVVHVEAGIDVAYAVRADGTVVGWGIDRSGNLATPSNVGLIKSICVGAWYTLALRRDGTLIGWGEYGRYGNLSSYRNMKSIDCENDGWVGLTEDGRVVGQGLYWNNVPVPGGLSDVVEIASGAYVSFARKTNGSVIAWGRNTEGDASVPLGLLDVVTVSAGHSAEVGIALRNNGSLIAWGSNTGNVFDFPAGRFSFVGSNSASPTSTLPPTRTFTPSRTLTPSRTATQTPTLTPTPNDKFSVDKADTGPERERRIYIPSGFTKSARYSVENGLMYTYTNTNSAQTASVRMPRVDYDAFTLEVWTLNSTTGKVDIDLGANGSIDWSTTFTQVGRSSSINMATALNTYLAGRTGTTVDIPIKITSARTGSLLVANVVGVPKPQSDLNATGITYDGTTTQSNGWTMAVMPRGVVSVVRATIKNDGRMPSDVSTAALAAMIPGDGLFYIDSQPIPRINPGSSTTVSFRWDTTQWPNMTGQVQVVIDPYNTLAERAEGNNLRMMNFRIQSGQIVASPTVTQTATNTRTATRTPTNTSTPTNTRTLTSTRTPTSTRTITATITKTVPPTMIAASALQVRYRFDEESSAMSYADVSGKANPLQCVANDASCPHTGSGAVNDDMGNAVYFDSASTTRLRTQNTISLGAGSFSISTWIRLDDTDRQQTIVSYGATANKLFAMGVTSDNKVFCQAGTKMAVSGASINTAGRMLTCIYDATASKLTLFVDRDAVTTTSNVLYSNVGDKLSLGARWLGANDPTEAYGGWLDEVNFWQGVLTARQIDALYNQPRSVVNRTPTRVGP